MRYVLFTAAAVILLALSAVAATQTQPATPEKHRMAEMQMMQNCPMQVPGSDVSVTDTKDGIALTITTKSGDVADLRRRTESMAKMHDNGMHGNMMPFSVKYEEIPNGARLTFTPKDPAKLEEFRNIVRHHAEHMNKHDCSMMQGMMRGMMGGMKPTEPGAKPEVNPKSDESDHSAHHPPGDKK
jgi:hypothetical protein